MDESKVETTPLEFEKRGVHFRENLKGSDAYRIHLDWNTIIQGERREKASGTLVLDRLLMVVANFDWQDVIAQKCLKQAWHAVNGEREERERREEYERWRRKSLTNFA